MFCSLHLWAQLLRLTTKTWTGNVLVILSAPFKVGGSKVWVERVSCSKTKVSEASAACDGWVEKNHGTTNSGKETTTLQLVNWRKQVFPPKRMCIAKPSICAFPGLKFRPTASMDDSCGCFGNGLCLVCSRASFSAIASGTHGGSDSSSTCDNCVYWTPTNCVCPEIAHTPIHCNYWWMGYLRYTLQFWTPNYIKLLSAQDWNILASQELGTTKFRPWDIAFWVYDWKYLGHVSCEFA